MSIALTLTHWPRWFWSVCECGVIGGPIRGIVSAVECVWSSDLFTDESNCDRATIIGWGQHSRAGELHSLRNIDPIETSHWNAFVWNWRFYRRQLQYYSSRPLKSSTFFACSQLDVMKCRWTRDEEEEKTTLVKKSNNESQCNQLLCSFRDWQK